MAGGDISDWFEPRTTDTKLDLVMIYDNVMGIVRYHIPHGRFIHVPPMYPCNDFDITSIKIPWWQDPQYVVGYLSERNRFVRMKNVLTGHVDLLEVPGEESVKCIFERYVEMNAHAWSYLGYVLRRQGLDGGSGAMEDSNEEPYCDTRMCDSRSQFGPPHGVVDFCLHSPATDKDDVVNMFREAGFEKNLAGNGVMDESEEYGRCGIAINHLIPVMDIRYTDDLTEDA